MTERGFRIVLAIVGVAVSFEAELLLGVGQHTRFLSLVFVVAFLLALVSEVAIGIYDAIRNRREREGWLIGSAVVGAGAIAAAAMFLGWEPALFLLLFLAIWHLARTDRPASA
jgi:hypothetical protein